MALHGKFVMNDGHYSPLSFPGGGTFLAFSGDGAYRNRGACGMIPKMGPVPAGKYWIVDRPEGGLKSQVNTGLRDIYNYFARGATFKYSQWFALWRDDWGIDDYTWIEGVKRGNFRLHPGVVSEGCITLPHDSDFAMLRNALLRTQKIDVPCMRKLQAYGTIEVITNGKKHALSLFIKIALFTVVMLIVAKVIPYDSLVGPLIGLLDFQSASKITGFILGEPDLEVWESLRDYCGILINILISVPILSAIITAYNTITCNVDQSGLPKEWAVSTLRRFVKIFGFTFLFWVLFRFLPYQSAFPYGETYPTFIIAAIIALNLLLTIACYGFIKKKITNKRSL